MRDKLKEASPMIFSLLLSLPLLLILCHFSYKEHKEETFSSIKSNVEYMEYDITTQVKEYKKENNGIFPYYVDQKDLLTIINKESDVAEKYLNISKEKMKYIQLKEFNFVKQRNSYFFVAEFKNEEFCTYISIYSEFRNSDYLFLNKDISPLEDFLKNDDLSDFEYDCYKLNDNYFYIKKSDLNDNYTE